MDTKKEGRKPGSADELETKILLLKCFHIHISATY